MIAMTIQKQVASIENQCPEDQIAKQKERERDNKVVMIFIVNLSFPLVVDPIHDQANHTVKLTTNGNISCTTVPPLLIV